MRDNQITVGQLINLLETVGATQHDGSPKEVQYDFGYMKPVGGMSWRGIYAELALGYTENGKGINTVQDLIDDLKSCIGKTFEGYKGGGFMMDTDTPLWVANYGNAGSTAVSGIKNESYQVIILTSYCEC